MTSEELLEKTRWIQKMKCETATVEIKSAHEGCPKRLYDTLSSFSNQDDGGVIIFGIDESRDFAEVGVYDPQDLQKKINEQCLQMEPTVRVLLTVAQKDGKFFVSAEIPGIDPADRPCFYKGSGRIKGSYVRVGDSDEHMTEYEIYSYEAFRRKYQDDIREVGRATLRALDENLLNAYMARLRDSKPKLAALPDDVIRELVCVTRDNAVTLASAMLFCAYPQAYFPQLCVTAIVVPGTEIGDTGYDGERFLDNQRIEGNIPDMLDESLRFVMKNMKRKTIINQDTGKREDRTDYPITAVREAVINALVHRDYSIHTEGMPIQLIMYEDRMEVRSPGGVYGRIRVDQLGKVHPDTRNPVIATALEVLSITENRYSGIPTIQSQMRRFGLSDAQFADERGNFIVRFYKEPVAGQSAVVDTDAARNLLAFCQTPRTRKEICEYLGLSSASYAIKTYVTPLVDAGQIRLGIPDRPASPKQTYTSVRVGEGD